MKCSARLCVLVPALVMSPNVTGCHSGAGSQSLMISSGAASAEADNLSWKRVSVASIGLKGPLSLQLPLPVGPHQVDREDSAQALHVQEAIDLMQGWRWITKVSSLSPIWIRPRVLGY